MKNRAIITAIVIIILVIGFLWILGLWCRNSNPKKSCDNDCEIKCWKKDEPPCHNNDSCKRWPVKANATAPKEKEATPAPKKPTSATPGDVAVPVDVVSSYIDPNVRYYLVLNDHGLLAPTNIGQAKPQRVERQQAVVEQTPPAPSTMVYPTVHHPPTLKAEIKSDGAGATIVFSTPQAGSVTDGSSRSSQEVVLNKQQKLTVDPSSMSAGTSL